MKKLLACIIPLLFFLRLSNAQSAEAVESSEKLGGSFRNAITLIINEASPEEILRDFKKLLKEHDAKVKNNGNDLSAIHAKLPQLADTTVDVFATAVKENEGTRFSVAFVIAGRSQLNSAGFSGGFRAAKTMVQSFSADATRNAINNQIKLAENELKKTEWKKSELDLENTHLLRDIENYKEKISRAEKELATNVKAREENKVIRAEQQKTIDDTKLKLLKYK